MRIAMTTFGCDGGRSGIGRYATQILRALGRIEHGHDVEVLVHADERDALLSGVRDVSVRTTPGLLTHPILDIAWHQAALPAW